MLLWVLHWMVQIENIAFIAHLDSLLGSLLNNFSVYFIPLFTNLTSIRLKSLDPEIKIPEDMCLVFCGSLHLSDFQIFQTFQTSFIFRYLIVLFKSLLSHSIVSYSFSTHGLLPILYSWDSSGKNTGVSCHFLFQGIFLTQGSNLCLLSLLFSLAGGFFTTEPPETSGCN